MRRIFTEDYTRRLSVFWAAIIIGGIFLTAWVRILPNIGIAGLFLTGVSYARKHGLPPARRGRRGLLSFCLVYALYLVSGLARVGWTNAELWRDLGLQIPFVLLPIAFWLLPDWEPAHLRLLWRLLLLCCLVAATGVTINYFRHPELINQLYLESKVMPTVMDHIRFSLLISMAALAGLVQLAQGWGRTRWLGVAGVGLLFLFQHLLAVRSGLVTLYAGSALWLLWLGWRLRRWRLALGVALVSVLLGLSSVLLFPTLQNKIINTRTDTEQLDEASTALLYSVAARVYSFQVAGVVIRQHPWVGVSKPGLSAAMADQYGYLYPEVEPAHYLLPHNQFIYSLAAYGVVGMIVFLVGFYYPLWMGIRQRNILLLLMYLVVTMSFLVEYTLETHVGLLTGLFFILLAAAPTVQVASSAPAATGVEGS